MSSLLFKLISWAVTISLISYMWFLVFSRIPSLISPALLFPIKQNKKQQQNVTRGKEADKFRTNILN